MVIPDLRSLFFSALGERRKKMQWIIGSTDAIMQEGYLLADFVNLLGKPLNWISLQRALASVAHVNDISIYSLRVPMSAREAARKVSVGDFNEFRVCLSLHDSTEWTFFSDSRKEFIRLAELLTSNVNDAIIP